MSIVEIYTDGASRGNPGPGGYGVVLRYEDKSGKLHERELSQGYLKTSNNRMELLAAIVGLEALKSPCDVTVYTDSQYLANAFNQHWVESWLEKGWKTSSKKAVKNIDLWKRLLKAMEPHNVKYTWVKGHAGCDLNERCDELATAAADSENLVMDEGFESLTQTPNLSSELFRDE